MNDFLPLNRQITKHWLWKEKPYSKGQAWVDLLLKANYKDINTVYKGQLITCKRGDVNTSILSLASDWGWDRKKVRNFLSALEQDGMVATNATTHRTTITIVNYENFNDYGTTNGTTDRTTKGQQDTQPLPTSNKDNKDNNNTFIYTRVRESEVSDESFDGEKAWIKTFDHYPKHDNELSARMEWVRMMTEAIEKKTTANLIYNAITIYKREYPKKRGDTEFVYVPKFDVWLREDCAYWIREYEKRRKRSDSG